jgi:hypothetical protein
MHLGPAGACGGLNFWNGPSRIAFGIRNLLGFERTVFKVGPDTGSS